MRRLAAVLSLALAANAAELERGKLIENIPTRADAAQTYTLYLPQAYDPAKGVPLLLVLDPRGRGTTAAEIFRAAAEEYGWMILSANGTHSDDGGKSNESAMRALLPELSRYAHNPRRVYATGFSGTAILACAVGLNTNAVAGVIGVGGRLVPQVPPAQFSFAHFGFAGDTDFNNLEMREIDAALERANKPHRFEEFDGDHRWIPAELADDAIGWMEVIAMKEQRRPRDEALIAKLYARDVQAAQELGDTLDALRRHRAIVRTFDGLHGVDESKAAIARLEKDASVRRAIADEAKWDEFAKRYVSDVFARAGNLFAVLRSEAPTTQRAAREFRVAELKRHASKDGAEGRTGRRLLEMVYAQTNFYLMRELFARREYLLAAAILGVATQIHPDRWPAWYNMGAAYARLNERKRALDALEKAFAAGFTNVAALAADEDYASVRQDPRYLKLLASPSQ